MIKAVVGAAALTVAFGGVAVAQQVMLCTKGINKCVVRCGGSSPMEVKDANIAELSDRPGGAFMITIDARNVILVGNGGICLFEGMTLRK